MTEPGREMSLANGQLAGSAHAVGGSVLAFGVGRGAAEDPGRRPGHLVGWDVAQMLGDSPAVPNALPRPFGSVNVVAISDRADGARSAAKTPWQARAVTNIVKLTAAPPTAEAAAKPTSPEKEGLLTADQIGGSPADQQQAPERQRVRGHDLLPVEVREPQVALRDGSARVITVASRTTMG